ncbi:MAG TPA: RNA polymerase sigma factor [Phycisphaerae bacterium]
MNAEDRQSLSRAVAGDREALGALLERYGPAVEQKLQIGARWHGLIEPGDVMQVSYIEAFLRIASFDVERADAFPAWLRRIAQNNLRDAIRALERPGDELQRIRVTVQDESYVALFDLLTSSHSTPSAQVRDLEACDLVHAALDRLPDDYARAVRLYDLEGRPIAEVAKSLGRSAGAVHMLRLRAHDRLRELLGSASRILDTNN